MNKRQRKKSTTEIVYRFKWNDDGSENLWKPGNYRTRLLYKLLVKYGVIGIGRAFKMHF